MPGRGEALMTAAAADKAIAGTAGFLREMRRHVETGVAAGKGLKAVYRGDVRKRSSRNSASG